MSSPVLLAADLFKHQGRDFRTNITYPLMGSVKFDGIRAFTTPQGLKSRERKLIRNHYIQSCLAGLDNNIDGELIAIDANGNDLPYRDTSSAVMSYEGEPKFRYRVFDYFNIPRDPYRIRYGHLELAVATNPFVEVVEQHYLAAPNLLALFLEHQLSKGREGVMIRDPNAPYKFGRSTMNEFFLVKVKPRETDVATIIGAKEMMENTNEATVSDNGYIKRSKAAEGMVPKNTLGALTVTHKTFGEFEIGGGTYLTAIRRKLLWDNRQHLPGLQVRFTYDNAKTSGYEKPRSPQVESLLGDIPSPLKASLT